MNKLMKTAIVAAGAALAVQGAFAAGNDLYLSINNNSGTPAGATEFTVNLGQLTSFNTGHNVDLSSFMSTFNSQFASAGVAGLNVGVVGGVNGLGGPTGNGLGNDVFTTSLRSSNIGSPDVAGSTGPNFTVSRTQIATAGGVVKQQITPGSNLAVTDPGSFTTLVAKDPTTAGTAGNNFTGALGAAANPLSTMTGTSIVIDLWKDAVISSTGQGTSGWVYQGNFTLDLSGAQPSLIWDAASAVPEPSTYGLFGGAGVLALALRRQFRRKTA